MHRADQPSVGRIAVVDQPAHVAVAACGDAYVWLADLVGGLEQRSGTP